MIGSAGSLDDEESGSTRHDDDDGAAVIIGCAFFMFPVLARARLEAGGFSFSRALEFDHLHFSGPLFNDLGETKASRLALACNTRVVFLLFSLKTTKREIIDR